VLRFVQRFQPALVGRVKLYTPSNPIFDEFGITAELEKALRPKVWLKSGGYIVINQTEALVAIDINTGKYVGKSNRLEDTIVKTNTDAIKEIVRQIRLRDLGGIIVVDFIDMDERKNRQKVMQALEEAMRADRAPTRFCSSTISAWWPSPASASSRAWSGRCARPARIARAPATSRARRPWSARSCRKRRRSRARWKART
jgi:Rne/Rng family ribonuclease